MKTVNLFEVLDTTEAPKLELVRIGSSETAIIPFVGEGGEVGAHYCEEPEISSWVKCKGNGCILCAIGKRVDQRILLPVFLPSQKVVAILPISPARTPHSLLPQLAGVLKSDFKQVVFIARDGNKYSVTTRALDPGADAGKRAIKQFIEDEKEGKVDIASVYQSITNGILLEIPSIKSIALLKGIPVTNAA